MARVPRLCPPEPGAGAGAAAAAPSAVSGRAVRPRRRVRAHDPLCQHHPRGTPGGLPRQPRDRAPHQEHHPLERHGDGGAGQPPRERHRRPHFHLRLLRHPLRGGVQPFFPGRHRRASGRHRLLPGARLPGGLRARVSGGAHQRKAAREFPPRARTRRRAAVLSAPVPHARLLAVPDRLDGAGADHVDLPGPFQPLHGGPRPQAAR